jgi:polyisoprenoid-binding protein YceI
MAVDTKAAVAGRTTWQIDPTHTSVEFAVKHMMFTTVKGRFAGVSGTIALDEANPVASAVDVEIDATSVDTREERRDGHLRSADFFDVEKYPTISFRTTWVEPNGPRAAKVHGELTIRDVTKPVTLETELLGTGTNPWGMEVAGFHAETRINRKEFGLGWNAPLEAGGVLVGDDIKIEIDLEATKQAA